MDHAANGFNRNREDTAGHGSAIFPNESQSVTTATTRPCELNDVGTIELLQRKLAEANRLNDELRKSLNDLRGNERDTLEYIVGESVDDSGRVDRPKVDAGLKAGPKESRFIPSYGECLYRGRKYKVEIVSTDYRVTEVA